MGWGLLLGMWLLPSVPFLHAMLALDLVFLDAKILVYRAHPIGLNYFTQSVTLQRA